MQVNGYWTPLLNSGFRENVLFYSTDNITYNIPAVILQAFFSWGDVLYLWNTGHALYLPVYFNTGEDGSSPEQVYTLVVLYTL